MMRKFSKNEKIWFVVIILSLLAIILKWESIWEGIKSGFEPYFNTEQKP